MIPIDTLIVFFAVSLILALSPGPDNIFVFAQSAIHGAGAGILVTLGLCTGLLVHTVAVSFGAAAVFQASAGAFTVLKSVGAAYLLYLAWQAFRTGKIQTNTEATIRNRWGLYSRGILMNITNPKVALFFLAFLPQFANAKLGSMTLQLLLFGGVFIIAALLVFGLIAWSAGRIGGWLQRSSRAQIVLNYVAGTVFAVLALRLIVGES